MSKPFYVIAHKVNQLSDISHAIRKGANAIECDVRHNMSRGFFVSHNPPDFDPVDLNDYLDEILTQARERRRLAMVIFDCKSAVSQQPDLAFPLLSKIRAQLTNRVPGDPLSILISTASFSNRRFLTALAPHLRNHEGVAIDEDDQPSTVAHHFQSVGIERHCYGNGTLSAGIEVDVPASILEGVALKAQPWGPRFVYVWTLNNKQPIRNFMRMGVDGIFVNHRGVLSRGIRSIDEILREFEFRRRLHLARRGHDPFVPSGGARYVLAVETGNVSHAGTDAELEFRLTGANGSLSTIINAKPPGLFEAEDRNSVTLEGGDIGPLRSLTVRRNTGGNAPGWYLKAITVTSSRLPSDHRFNFDTWIPRRGATRWVGQASYQFAVITSDVTFAGTDATVTFELMGSGSRQTLTHEVDGDAPNRFERGRTNQFTVPGPDLGPLQSLTVSHDQSGDASDWRLDRVRVRGPLGTRIFHFDRWISGRSITAQAQ